ncbi:MAG: hypothetical protein VKJ06_08305 [Vampirovibrionales bacterium]|nr:hypothetical protein [Vampirovibrionales bacterium]
MTTINPAVSPAQARTNAILNNAYKTRVMAAQDEAGRQQIRSKSASDSSRVIASTHGILGGLYWLAALGGLAVAGLSAIPTGVAAAGTLAFAAKTGVLGSVTNFVGALFAGDAAAKREAASRARLEADCMAQDLAESKETSPGETDIQLKTNS